MPDPVNNITVPDDDTNQSGSFGGRAMWGRKLSQLHDIPPPTQEDFGKVVVVAPVGLDRAAGFAYTLQDTLAVTGDYTPGLVILGRNNIVRRPEGLYYLVPSVPVPYTITGDWDGGEKDNFVRMGDPDIRADLAAPGGVSLVNGAVSEGRKVTGINGLQGGGELSQDLTLSPVYGTTANTVTQGNDARFAQTLQVAQGAVNTAQDAVTLADNMLAVAIAVG